jgi:ParB family transcriptional regulator, chromosome partitioning protein
MATKRKRKTVSARVRAPAKAPVKGSKNSKDVYGAIGKTNLLVFDPKDLLLVTDPEHPLYDGRVADVPEAWLMNSLEEFGQLQPVIVRKNPETDKTEVVVGRGRTLAMRALNERRAKEGKPAMMLNASPRKGDENIKLRMLVVAENEHRRGDNLMNKALKIRGLKKDNATPAMIARALRVEVGTIKNIESLLDATAVLQKAVREDKIRPSLAYALAKKPAEEQRRRVQAVLEAAKGDGTKREKSRAMRAAAGEKAKPKVVRVVVSENEVMGELTGEEAAAMAPPMNGAPNGHAAMLAGWMRSAAELKAALESTDLYGQQHLTDRVARSVLRWVLKLSESDDLAQAVFEKTDPGVIYPTDEKEAVAP